MSYLAEKNVIGSLLMDPDCISEIYSRLSQEVFKSPILGRVYLEFQKGYDSHYAVNLVTLEQKLRDVFTTRDLLQELGNCAMETSTSATVGTYADIVLSDYKAYRLKTYLETIKVSPDGIDNQIGTIITGLEAMQANREVAAKTLAHIAKENKSRYFREDGQQKMEIGLSALDDLLGGLQGGDVVVIGARPAVGKSAFVTQVAANLAKQNKRVGFFNLEMQEGQVYERFVAAESGIGLTRLRRATRFLGDEKERFEQANKILEQQENIVITTGSKTVNQVRSESRHMEYDVIIIDYLQLLKPDKAYLGNRYAEVGAVSRAVKAMAMEFNIPVIALSQLNRTTGAGEREPSMEDLREAGDIEQDASVILLLWNLSQKDAAKKGCKVAKQRQGRTGKIVLEFDGDLMRFRETGEKLKEAKEWAKVVDDDCPFH